MIKLEHVPVGLRDIQDWYGGAPAHVVSKDGKARLVADVEWHKANTIRVTLPFPLRLVQARSKVMLHPYIHRKVAPALLDALQEILDFGGHEFLLKYDLDLTGGIYRLKCQKGDSTLLSAHAYLIAIDYCPNYGPWGEPSRMPFFINDAFIRRGFMNYPRRDGMHYQACRGY